MTPMRHHFSVFKTPLFFHYTKPPYVRIVNLLVHMDIVYLIPIFFFILFRRPRGMIYLGDEGTYPEQIP
jgi:hypothetical protein